jgi:Protein of unknown function with HXXEE motif
MRKDTHGRWPLVAALAVGPVSAAAVRRPALRPLAALLCHQTEEWVWPGGFLPWLNREVLGSDEDEHPLDRRLAFAINVGAGWGGSLVASTGAPAAAPAAALYVSHLGNTAMHLSWAVRHRRYDPGLVTALVALTPAAIAGLRDLRADPAVSPRALRVGLVAGTAASIALMPLVRRRG